MKIRLLISYKGSTFFGWQKQKKQSTVQEEIENSLYKLFQKHISIVGSGRTDAGVHALGQSAHFTIEENLLKKGSLVRALNHFLPKDISILSAWKAPDSFHARFSAKKKTYTYFIWSGDHAPVLFRDLIWWKHGTLALDKLQNMAETILGKNDFKSFQSHDYEIKNSIRTIYQSKWSKLSGYLYCYTIQGDGFLKHMVRNLIGTYVDLLKEKHPEKRMQRILKSKDRKMALSKAPARGLYLKKVFYSQSLDKQCIQI